ncbi:MAG: hypothetical protein K6F73_01295 [Lachnospiraceae bacterium]|nr:hypothetical protein [Lachnospiraceae bacterium]
MIIRFDHITYIAGRSEKEALLDDLGAPSFFEEKLPNLKAKKELMRNMADDHDLYFFEGAYPTEYIFYDEPGNKSRITLKDGIIYGSYTDKEKARTFLEAIFDKKVTDEQDRLKCSMKGILDRQDYPLILEPAEQAISYVDDRGYGVPALIVNSDYSAPDGAVCTDSERITVNGKELDICFMKSGAADIIFELIKVAKETK